MKFDVVIIGGGLAGLTCGIMLQQKGKCCAIINNGQSAMNFSSGSMDLLSQLPNGEKINSFEQGYDSLEEQLPNHPYCLFGKQHVLQKAKQFEQLIEKINLNVTGSYKQNHFRVTPLGGLHRTWLSADCIPTMDLHDEHFGYQKITVLGIEGYHDFQPHLLAENLIQHPQFTHCSITTALLHLPELDQLRLTSREFRSVNISQLLEHRLAFRELVQEIKQASGGAEAVFLPACFGLDNQDFFNKLKLETGLNLYELPTLPPSLVGLRQHKKLKTYFEKLGGFILNGDKALRAVIEDQQVKQIYTQLHQEHGIFAEHFVLASGSFFSNGLVSVFDRLLEPIFDVDMIGNSMIDIQNRLTWTARRFSSPQPYQSAGVAINSRCQLKKSGQIIKNLYAAGNVIGGYNALELGCGSGVAVVTALTAADSIIEAQNRV
ncbi:glycerol-3-phosphate dehydrogenase subunit GlpB [Histophilus somni]|uniref:glycerol-3-phosphate dehydrogenase subunit GlpB n=1 Tax=Histophilus somni TaxID=731 RepID=UPI00201EBE0C|nr:glycerol-3-phosphate dehydrogenase subunit GlpB [Histophilus somni]